MAALKSIKVTTTAATPKALGATVARVLCMSTFGNTDTVYLGHSGANANGFAIGKDQIIGHLDPMMENEELDLSKIFVYSAAGTDGVTLLVLDRG